jgi:phosphatidylserine/phosphatidylglycerophosphate/cardiolipin synthase-like enzyme
VFRHERRGFSKAASTCAGLVVCLCTFTSAPVLTEGGAAWLRQDHTDHPGPSAGRTSLGPQEWAELALEGCRAMAARTEAADEALRQKLAAQPTSREQGSFLAREAAARDTVGASGRRAVLNRVNALLFGGRAAFPDRDSSREETFREVLEDLLDRKDVCALEAIEATVLFGIFGMTFDATAARHLRPDREFLFIDEHLSEHVKDGDTVEQVFEHARPQSFADAAEHVEAVTREALLVRDRRGLTDVLPPGAERRLRQFLEFIAHAAEPVRIQNYLHARVADLEVTLGVAIPEQASKALFERVDGTLYSSIDRMRRLRDMPPTAVIAAVDPIVDRWFRSTALPALRRSIETRPFAAYWFFVQAGAVAAPGPVFSGSRVEVRAPAYALSALSAMSVGDAIARIKAARVPARFLTHHASLESAFTALTLSPDEVRERIDRSRLPARVAVRLREFMIIQDAPSGGASSLDVYARLIRDASRIRGRLDRDVIDAAIGVMSAAKVDRLDREIDRILVSQGSPDPRLEAYLRTAAALMLELEQRQVTDAAFRQSTAGAAIGWLLSRFFIGGAVPIALWAPEGVTGPEFAELVDEVAPKNRDSGNDYHGKPADGIDFVHDGREYHQTLITVIDSARHFLNISSFDWKTDAGGRDIAYRLMAKKLGLDGAAYARFLATFERGLPMEPARPAVVAFYDIPTTRMKDLLVTYFIKTSDHPEIARAREALYAAGATLECSTVMTCGDLDALFTQTGARYGSRGRSSDNDHAWEAYRQLEALLAERPPPLSRVHPRRALRDYFEEGGTVRRFVRRFGLRRADRPAEPVPINIVTDAKQNLFNLRVGERSEQFPYFLLEPIRDVYFMLLEFDVRLILWKGPLEFPWHVGPVPIPGRKLWGLIPMPLVPYPWLNAIPGFQWLGPCASLLLQYFLATDVRIWWASVNHTKSWSNETWAIESGMGMGSKYFNFHDEHRTWHDMGVLVRGAPVDDVNDHFVEVFNEARVNNTGLPGALGADIPRLRYEDYRRAPATRTTEVPADQNPVRPASSTAKTWLLTTHPEHGDSNYRGVFVAALAGARRNIYVENSFFSDPLIARMLIHKAREFRGRVSCAGLDTRQCAERTREAVQIYLVLPDSSDKPIVDAVGAADFHEMLHLGIRVHRWQPAAGWSASKMLHSKVWLIDYEPGKSGLTYVGAANATQRSHLADNEAGILSNDAAFADQVYEELFHPDITADSRVESGENFYLVWSSNRVVRASRWLRRLLVELFWFI